MPAKKQTKPKAVQGIKTSFDLCKIIDVYLLASKGHSNSQIAEILGYNSKTLLTARKKIPAVQDAIDRGRSKYSEGRSKTTATKITLAEFVLDSLSPREKQLWDRLMELQESPTALAQIEELFAFRGAKRARQSLYLYALIHTHYDRSRAASMVGISNETVKVWARDDEVFGELIQQIQEHKKDFFESHLVKLVESGDNSATIFANKTINRDRGYSEKVTIEHTGTIEQRHIFSIEDLELPHDIQMGLLEAIRERRRVQNGAIETTAKRIDSERDKMFLEKGTA